MQGAYFECLFLSYFILFRANPTEGQKRFHRLTEMLKRKNDGFQIEVLQLATFCRTVVNPTNTKIEELIRPNFRLPSTDEFFQVAIKQLLDRKFLMDMDP